MYQGRNTAHDHPPAGRCPECDSIATLCPGYPGDYCDCASCGASWKERPTDKAAHARYIKPARVSPEILERCTDGLIADVLATELRGFDGGDGMIGGGAS